MDLRVLLVEDSARLQKYVAKGLRHAGYAVDTAGDGDEGLWYALENEYDVVILDILLPKRDGLHVLQTLRERGSTVHVLLLTAKDTVSDRVAGLEQGADDYLVKPFAFEELLARVQALVRRKYGVKSSRLKVGDLIIDTAQRSVLRDGETLPLRPREYALLELLMLRKGEVVPRTEIEQHIYDERAEPASNVVDSAICILRKKIERGLESPTIETRRGLGYLLQEPK